MKKMLFVAVLIFYCKMLLAQDFDLITYDDTQNIEVTQRYPNGTDFKRYQSQNGYIYKIGDPIFIGQPSTNSNEFTHLIIGRYNIGRALLIGPPISAPGAWQAKTLFIDKIFVYHPKGSRKSLVVIWMYLKDPDAPAMYNITTVADFDKALMLGEIFNPNAPLSKEEAIARLKETKELLDLGVIQQSKYDSMKAALTPVILSQ
jgi:hypothetical protein